MHLLHPRRTLLLSFPWRRNRLRLLESFGQMKVVHLLFQILNPLPTGTIPAPHRTNSAWSLSRSDLSASYSAINFSISVFIPSSISQDCFTCMSANLVKYLHLHNNFQLASPINLKENSFSCLSRAIAASSRALSFPKAPPRAQEPSTHSRAFPKAPPRAQEPPPHSRSIPQAPPRAQEPPTHSRSIPQAPPRAQEPPPHSRSIPPSTASCARTATTLTKHSPSIASCARTANTRTKHSPSIASCARTATTLTKHPPSTASCARTANTLTKLTCSSASVRFAKPK